MKSARDLVVQSSLAIVQGARESEHNSSAKQKGPQPQRSQKPGKTIMVRDDYLIIMNLEDSFDLPFSLWNKNDRMLWEELKRKLKLPKIESLIVTRLTRRKGSKDSETTQYCFV